MCQVVRSFTEFTQFFEENRFSKPLVIKVFSACVFHPVADNCGLRAEQHRSANRRDRCGRGRVNARGHVERRLEDDRVVFADQNLRCGSLNRNRPFGLLHVAMHVETISSS